MKKKKTESKKTSTQVKQPPDNRIRTVESKKNEEPKLYQMVKLSESPDIPRRDFIQKVTKIAGFSGIAALTGALSQCKRVDNLHESQCLCDLQSGSGNNACTCDEHDVTCTCDTVAPCACNTVCTCDLDNGERVLDGSKYTKGVCTCNTVCTCNKVTPCTCDGHCSCQSTCSCQYYGGHYWYPN